MAASEETRTPWRRVFAKFGLSQSELAREMETHRAKVCRALSDPKGLISGRDQETLVKVARRRGVDLRADDLTPTP